MRRILDFHLSDRLHLHLAQTNDQLIAYDELLDFIYCAQELYSKKSNLYNNNNHPINGKRPSIPLIPSIHSSFILPSIKKPIISPLPQSTTIKTSPVKSPLPITNASQSNNTQRSTSVLNGHHTSQLTSTIVPVKSNQSSLSIPPELCPISLHNAKIEGEGWAQINNVYLPFIIKNGQRLVPYQVLVSCKILEQDELHSALTRATISDITLINSMIHNCKINSEQIPENTSLINIYHVLIGTKNLVYVKILLKDNPTLKINRQYKSVLALRGGSLYITNHLLPFVCSSNHTYISLNHILIIYPNLYQELKILARVPRTNELDYLQLIQIYYNEKELPLDTLVIDLENLRKKKIIPTNMLTLNEYHEKEKVKFQQQIILLNNLSTNKRKNTESYENKQSQQKFKSSIPSNPPTGYFPAQLPPSNQSHVPTGYFPAPQQSHWLSSNNGHRGRTRWQ
jgi:hypothetical protein